MANAKFNFNGKEINIQCKTKDSLKDICEKFAFKIKYDINKLIFIYGGDILIKIFHLNKMQIL